MTSGIRVPFVDLITPHREMEEELLAEVRAILRSASFVGGPAVERFEAEFAAFCGTPDCAGVGSGTDALRFALMALGVEPGDVVVTVPNTFVATVEAIIQAGGTPAFVDVDPATYNMDPSALEAFLHTECEATPSRLIYRKTGQTVKAVVPVHLYGQMCAMDEIGALAETFGLTVVEDACQAHGAEYFSRPPNAWVKAGSVGRAAAFSFYPGKNLGACGEAGAVTSHDPEVIRRVRMIRDHGQNQKYHHAMLGYNGRLDAIQAAFLSLKLRRLPEWNEKRRDAARRYDALFASVGAIGTPVQPGSSRSVFHLYVITTPERDGLLESLRRQGIGASLHYPIPIHQLEGYRHLGYPDGALPVSEALAGKLLSLPMFPGLSERDIEAVARAVTDFHVEREASHAIVRD